MAIEDREDITGILGAKKWPPFLGDASSVNRFQALFFEDKIRPQAPDPRALASEVGQIMQAVCSYYRLDESEWVKSRRGWFNEPRTVAVHLVRTMRKDSFADMASEFGLRGYSSVYAVDTTGAGDIFHGALALRIACGEDLLYQVAFKLKQPKRAGK